MCPSDFEPSRSCIEAHPHLAAVVAISQKAGEAILAIYKTDFCIEKKADQSPLTQADLAAHHIIVQGLQNLTPDIPILSEESAYIDFAQRRQWHSYWLVDPLDGTREFVKRNGEFTVNIALIEDQRPVLGIIYAPVLDVTYVGAGLGMAWKKRSDTDYKPIQVRSFNAEQAVVAGSRSHRGSSLEQFLSRLGKHQLISMGSSLKSCLVAEGTADVYPRFGPTSEWDTAAAQAIVESAGGQLITLDGQAMRYNTKAALTNPSFMVIADKHQDWRGLIKN